MYVTSMMTRQNGQALDWLFAEDGEVCHTFGEHCCTHTSRNIAPNGIFTEAMNKFKHLRGELKENTGRDVREWDDLDKSVGEWGALAAKIGISEVIAAIIMISVQCCIIPIARRWITGLLSKRVTTEAGLQLALWDSGSLINP